MFIRVTEFDDEDPDNEENYKSLLVNVAQIHLIEPGKEQGSIIEFEGHCVSVKQCQQTIFELMAKAGGWKE